MEKIKTLQEVMNDLARQPQRNMTPAEERGRVTEETALLTLDPVAAGLRKNREDARGYHRDLLRLRGADDPLTEVAADMADSAESALQTRLIELRADPEICRAARRLRRRMSREIEQEGLRQSALFRARLQMFYLRQITARHEVDERARREASFILFLFWMLMIMLQRAQDRLRLVADFAIAVAPARKEAAASG